MAVRFPDDGGADKVVAAIGEQILGPTDVSLSNWTAPAAALRGALPGAGPAQPDGRTADVYGLQILHATLQAGNTAEEEDTAASALLLKHKFLDGGADDVTLATRQGAAGATGWARPPTW